MSFTPFNAPLLSGLLGDLEIAAFFSVKADLKAMLRFEVALAEAEAAEGLIPADAATRIAEIAVNFDPDMAALQQATARDGMAVPEFVRQLRTAVGAPEEEHVHFGATSQDAIDTSLTLRLKDANAVIARRLSETVNLLVALSERFGKNSIVGRTRMQVALPVTTADRIRLWLAPLTEHLQTFETLLPRVHRLQFAGPVGTLDKLDGKGPAVRKALAARLELTDPEHSWHTDRSVLVDYANWLSLVTGALGKMGQDMALMAQNEIGEISYDDAGASSAMPHKQNPIKAEALVTLARFNATLVSGMHHAVVHEQERSGTAWTLEWMLLPQLAVATGASLRNAQALLTSVQRIGPTDNK